eukprot:1194890-Prorocentrum_minimum.AAC.3
MTTIKSLATDGSICTSALLTPADITPVVARPSAQPAPETRPSPSLPTPGNEGPHPPRAPTPQRGVLIADDCDGSISFKGRTGGRSPRPPPSGPRACDQLAQTVLRRHRQLPLLCHTHALPYGADPIRDPLRAGLAHTQLGFGHTRLPVCIIGFQTPVAPLHLGLSQGLGCTTTHLRCA